MPYLDILVILNKSWAEERIESPTDILGMEEDGTGAYCFDSIADNGDVTLKRFADYHGEAGFDTIYMKVITGDTEMAFESGDLDMSRYKKSTYDVVAEYDNVLANEYPVNSVGFMSVGLTTDFGSYLTLFTDLNLAIYNGQDVQDAFADMKDEAGTKNAMKVVTESLAYMPVFYPYAFYIFDDDLNVGDLYATYSGFLYKDFSWK